MLPFAVMTDAAMSQEWLLDRRNVDGSETQYVKMMRAPTLKLSEGRFGIDSGK